MHGIRIYTYASGQSVLSKKRSIVKRRLMAVHINFVWYENRIIHLGIQTLPLCNLLLLIQIVLILALFSATFHKPNLYEIKWIWNVQEIVLLLCCNSCVTAPDRPQTRSSVSAATWPHARSIATKADVRDTRTPSLQVNALRSITRTTNQR